MTEVRAAVRTEGVATDPVARRSVHVVVPDGIDDPRSPSGGNTYDRRVCLGLPAFGWAVLEHPVAGAWPRPGAGARAALSRTFDGIPDGATVLIDGLVACGVPEIVAPQARRLRIVVLVHLPLGDELFASEPSAPEPSAPEPPAPEPSAPKPSAPEPPASELSALERRTLRAVDTVVTTSGWAARRVVAQHGLPTGRVHIVAPGTEPGPLAAGTDGASRLLCVGAVTPTKGQDLLVDALSTVTDRRWRCDLVGPLDRAPAHVAAIRQVIERHGLGHRIALTGPLHADRLADAYATTDLLVLPSRAETYGMVITEALARGIPVLAAATGGVVDTLGRTQEGAVPGMLVPPADPSALAEALRRWFDEPALRDRLRRAAGQRRNTLTGWEVTTRCLATVLEQTCGAAC